MAPEGIRGGHDDDDDNDTVILMRIQHDLAVTQIH